MTFTVETRTEGSLARRREEGGGKKEEGGGKREEGRGGSRSGQAVRESLASGLRMAVKLKPEKDWLLTPQPSARERDQNSRKGTLA